MPSATARRSRVARSLRLVLVALLLGAVLAVAPRPAFAVERAVELTTESPELVPVTEPGPAEGDGGTDDGGTDDFGTGDGGAAGATSGGTDGRVIRQAAEATGIDDFELIGATFAAEDVADGRIRVQVDGTWGPWWELTNLEGDHGPDLDGAEAAGARPASDPIWVGDGEGYQLDLPPDARDLEVHLVRETEERVRIVDGTEQAGAYQMPTVRPRSAWGARAPRQAPGSASYLDLAVVHHTVNSNAYSPTAVPGMIRSIQAYHMDAQGWWDIGYNFVVDRFGRIWEGRAGSTYKAVIGAHARNSNTGSTGAAWLGDGSGAGLTSAGLDAFARLIAWKLPLHGTFFTGPEIVGHRDVSSTACPGNGVHGQLGALRTRARQLRPPPGPYLDVPDSAWNAAAISWGKETGVVNGYRDGNFRPQEGLTRAQFVNMLWGLAGEPGASTRHGLKDVPRSSWLTGALDWAVEQGVITGFSDGTFRGDVRMRRDTIAVQLWRWATAPAVDSPHGFSDIAPGVWSEEALRWAKATGVVNGFRDGTYRPAQTVKRGQVLPMLFDLRPFTDVGANAWFQPGAHWGLHQRIALGFADRTFRGNQGVNRAQGTSMLWRMMDRPAAPAPPAHGWPDVADGAWYEDALDWATAAGWVDGKGDGGFHGADPLLRHETVLWIWRMAGSPPATIAHGFNDVPAGAAYDAALDWAVEHGIVSGFGDGGFHPDDEVNRAQWMMMLYRLASSPAAWAGGVTPPTTTLF